MKADRWDPPRVDEQAPKALLDFVRTARARSPDDAALDRMAKRLTATARATPAPKGVQRSDRMPAYVKVGVVVLAAGGIALLSWRVTHEPLPAVTTAPEIPRSVTQAATEPATMPSAEEAAPEPATPGRSEAISVDDLPVAAPRATPISGSGSTTRPTATSAKPSPTELELFKRAEAALSADPARALSLTSEQARLYAAGEFVQEREVIAVEALARMGRNEEALRRARALVERFPRTPYATRLEVAVGRPLSSISGSANRMNTEHRGSALDGSNP